MKKITLVCILIFSLVVLTACNEVTHSVQFGSVNREGMIKLKSSLTDEEVFQRVDKLLKDAENVSIDSTDLDHLSKGYIQLTNEQQNIISSNYILWQDEANERFICYPFLQSSDLYYEVSGNEYLIMKRYVNTIRESEEKIETLRAKQEGTPYEVQWTYDD